MNQIGLFDICIRFHGGNTESKAANKSIAPKKNALCAKVLDYIRDQGVDGATCCEIEKALDLSHQTASARCSELKKLKLVIESGKRRPTRTGAKAAVLRCVK